MLTNDEMARIRAEEEAAALVLLERRQAPRRARARRRYRAQVRGQLRPGFHPFWLLLGGLAAAILTGLLAWPRAPMPDDTSGGIASSLLMLRCKQEVRARLGDTDLRFPGFGEAAHQMTASAEGKRWDGRAETPDGRHADFSCGYTPATDQLGLELIPTNF